MPSDSPDYWFPAKRYGWGWGLPLRWQGWVAIAVYVVLMAAGMMVLRPAAAPVGFVLYTLGVSALLVLVCWWKGEPPRWRWGED